MAFEILTIPFNNEKKIFNCEDLNNFCLNKRIISSKTEFFKCGERSYWTIFLEYDVLLKQQHGNQPKNLTEAGFLCFEKLKEWRKEKAEKEESRHLL